MKKNSITPTIALLHTFLFEADFLNLCFVIFHFLVHISSLSPTRHRASTEHSLTFHIRTMLSYCEAEASLLVGWSLMSLFITNTGKIVTTVRIVLP